MVKNKRRNLTVLASPDELRSLANYLVDFYQADENLKGSNVDWNKVKYAIPITNLVGYFEDWSINWKIIREDLKQ